MEKLEPTAADGGGSVAREAIRVPAFGTSQPTAMTLAESGPSKPAARPRKRVAPHPVFAIDAPPPAYWRPLHYRFGYGYGPGLRLYRW